VCGKALPLHTKLAQRVCRGVALQILKLSARRGCVVSAMPQVCTWERDLVSIVYKAGWSLGSVLLGLENITPTGVQTPDRPAPSELLYRLRCPVCHMCGVVL